MTEAKLTNLQRNLLLLIKQSGRSRRANSLAAGVGDSGLKNIMENKSKNPRQDTLEKLARHFGVTVSELVGSGPLGADPARRFTLDTQVEVYGDVQAGAFRPAWEWDEEDRYTVKVKIDPRYPTKGLHGLEIRGDSMDQIFAEGSVVAVVNSWDLGEEWQPSPRDLVLVLRQSPETDDHEATVKELILGTGGERLLVPRSNNPRWSTIEFPPISRARGDCSDRPVYIAGIVVGFAPAAEVRRQRDGDD